MQMRMAMVMQMQWQLFLQNQLRQNPVVQNPPAPVSNPTAPSTQSAELTSAGVIKLVNEARAKQGLAPLTENQKLSTSAKMKAEDMLKNQYFAHNSPSGTTPSYLADSAGYVYSSFGENLAYGNFKNNDALMNGWMNSSGHKANILNPSYTEIGVSVIKGKYNGREVWMAVQHFGKPR